MFLIFDLLMFVMDSKENLSIKTIKKGGWRPPT